MYLFLYASLLPLYPASTNSRCTASMVDIGFYANHGCGLRCNDVGDVFGRMVSWNSLSDRSNGIGVDVVFSWIV